MKQVCATVMSEGGYIESGIDWTTNSGSARTTSTTAGTRLPLLAIRLKNTFQGYPNRITVRPNNISMYVATHDVYYELIKVPGVSSLATTDVGGLVWTSVDDSSGVEYCRNATSFAVGSNLDIFASGIVVAGNSQNSLSPVNSGELTSAKKNTIVQNFDSTDSEIFVVSIRTIISTGNSTASAAATLQWREIY
jgi:hypothetical protein